ncbi:UNVERIFIED_CONTAM: hypothetical protein FKN15_006006 [Acipenser sinensis]
MGWVKDFTAVFSWALPSGMGWVKDFTGVISWALPSGMDWQFPTRPRRPEGSVDVLRSHDRASFLFYTQELESGCQRATSLWRTKAILAGVCSVLTGRLASRVRCSAIRRTVPAVFASLTHGSTRANATLPSESPAKPGDTAQPGCDPALCDFPLTHRSARASATLPSESPAKPGDSAQPGCDPALCDFLLTHRSARSNATLTSESPEKPGD